MKRILVTGSRGWQDRKAIHSSILKHAVDQQTGEFIGIVVHGDCSSGADAIAKRYCQWLGLKHDPHPADWDTYGKGAGFRRNSEMAKLGADICLAFWDGESHGTKHMIDQCKKQGIPVEIIRAS